MKYLFDYRNDPGAFKVGMLRDRLYACIMRDMDEEAESLMWSIQSRLSISLLRGEHEIFNRRV